MPNKQLLAEILSFVKKYSQDSAFLQHFSIDQHSDELREKSTFIVLLKFLFGQMLFSWGLVPGPSNLGQTFSDLIPKNNFTEISQTFSKYAFGRSSPVTITNDELDSAVFCELYEGYLDIERHSTGSFYTPDFIAYFMSEVSLNRIFFDQLSAENHHIHLEDFLEIASLPEDLLKSAQSFAGKFLGRLKICDPACGTGRFLIAIAKYIEQFFLKITSLNNSLFDAFPDFQIYLRKYILEQCIFGVEKDPFAAEICKLRLFAWFVELWPVNGNPLELYLPELDHIKVGNSLFGLAHEYDLTPEIKKNLQICSKDQSRIVGTTNKKIKASLRKTLAKLVYNSRKILDHSFLTKLMHEEAFKNSINLEDLNPFHWAFEFPFRFTLLIGNPPYGNILSKSEKEILQKWDQSSDEVYVNFLLRILRDDIPFSYACFLTPKSFLIRQSYLDLRHQLFTTACPYYIYDIGSKMFKGALNEVQVLCFHRNTLHSPLLRIAAIGKQPQMAYRLSGQGEPNNTVDEMKTCPNKECPGMSESSQFSIYTRLVNCPVCGAPTTPLHRIRMKINSTLYWVIDHIEQIANLNFLNPRDFPDLKRGEEDQGLKRVRSALEPFNEKLCAFITAKNDFSPFYLHTQKSFALGQVQTQKDPRFYTAGPKMLIKHNSIVPEAAFTRDATCFTAAVYSLLHPDENILKYLCGLLNSTLMQFYCIYGINNQNLVTMNLNQYMIRHLPLIAPQDAGSTAKAIVKCVNKILEKTAHSAGKSDTTELPELKNLDQAVFALYNITGEDTINLIQRSVEESMQTFSKTRRKK